MMGEDHKSSIIIVTWNSREFLQACLRSLSQDGSTSSYEVVIVDNGSVDKTGEIVGREFPDMMYIRNSQNRGVAPARNQGLEAARGEYCILLDVDTVVHPASLDILIDFMDRHPDVGLCGPRLVSPHGELQRSCRRYPTLWDKILRRIPLPFAQRYLLGVELADWDHGSVRDVDYVIGACQAIRRQALRQVGLFDERIFYGPEDVDLCLRLRKAGWRVVYVPQAVVMHHERRLTRHIFSPLGVRHLYGLLYYFWKHGYLFSRQKIYQQLAHAKNTVRQ